MTKILLPFCFNMVTKLLKIVAFARKNQKLCLALDGAWTKIEINDPN